MNWEYYSFFFANFQVLDEISEHGIRIYQLPDADSDEDEEFKEQTRVLKASFTPSLSFCCCSSSICNMPKRTLFLSQCVENFSFLCVLTLNYNPFYSSLCFIRIPSVVCHDFVFFPLLSVNHCSPWTSICSLFSDSNVLTCEPGERLWVL